MLVATMGYTAIQIARIEGRGAREGNDAAHARRTAIAAIDLARRLFAMMRTGVIPVYRVSGHSISRLQDRLIRLRLRTHLMGI